EQLRALMGEADPSVTQLTVGIRDITARHYDRFVMPLIREHWPAMLRDPFAVKLRLAACDLYASAPYTVLFCARKVLFCARKRPLSVALITGLGNRLVLPNAVLALAARAALNVLGRVALADEHRRIILIASFIAVIDHAFDHCMDDPPPERGRKLHALLDGRWEPDTPSLKLTRAIQVEMQRELPPSERALFEQAIQRLKDWVDSEVAGMSGVADTTGLGHRLAGIEGTIDGLLFPVHRYAGEVARPWMYEVSLFIQMMDDYIDIETDTEDGRLTPVISGEWTLGDITRTWRKTIDGIEALTRAGGHKAPHYVRFIREAYVLMLGEVLAGMASGLAD
ncbi:MAG: hypothetical protein JRD94_07830, partial [Deltaproteobacteria bacterium]|nr:hypothetical protein [Deltaproteobacteria bacterium]